VLDCCVVRFVLNVLLLFGFVVHCIISTAVVAFEINIYLSKLPSSGCGASLKCGKYPMHVDRDTNSEEGGVWEDTLYSGPPPGWEGG